MKIYITGISGFLSINLVRYLLAQGYEDISGIDLVDFTYPERDQITFLQGDIRDREAVKRSMQGADIVIHTAAALPLYTPEEIYSTDVEGTRILFEQALEYGVKRFIHISSTAVYGVPDHHPLYETDKMIGVGPYGEAKVKAEEICHEFRDKGMCVPVLRPKSFVGPERLGVFAIFYEWASEGRHFPMIGSGNNRYQLLDVEDLCRAIHACITLDADAVNDTFNIGAARYTTMKQDYQAVLDAAGFGKRIIPFPVGPVILALKVLEAMKLSPLYPWIYETASKDSFVSIEKAQKVLGFDPQYSNQEAMLRNYQWYLENKDGFTEGEGVTHRVPWKQQALKLFKVFF
ncbi:epimerase [Ornatilinea apprima]|uniref:Epimerase n=1 Tax=Ornatilinea apprima TaxID=1134406 RepID=A0A0P6XQ16_9CHLR|nr:NAD-dependent epimerase/dehydratase family protein [Ornatilinea apprima]KPL78827.1 epimerase [Ornatilinea apprima]